MEVARSSFKFWERLNGMTEKSGWATSFRLIFLLVVVYAILITAWVGDDIQLTFRQVWNFINGDGITFNYGERVQAFTHPLWFIVLSLITAVTRELFLTSILVNATLSILAIIFLVKIEVSTQRNTLAIVSPLYALLCSWAFVDYATSGLENALSYFLIGLLLYLLSLQQFENKFKLIYLVLALLVLNRLDYAVLLLPLALVLISETKTVHGFLSSVWPGVLLLGLWFIFATVYFGSPLPNTFYAKLNADYPLEEVIFRGRRYFQSLRLDHVSTLIIISGQILSVMSLKRNLIALTLGQVGYLVYILFIGGDFMQGRFFAVPVFLAMGQIILSFTAFQNSKFRMNFIPVLGFMAIAVFIGFHTGFPILSGTDYQPRRGVARIVDERGQYYQKFGLFSESRNSWPSVMDMTDSKPETYRTSCQYIGGFSLLDTSYHLLDICALTDPFLSRLPAVRNNNWLIGHHTRRIPLEYGEFLIGTVDELPDKKLSSLLTDKTLVARGDLFSFERLRAIFRLNMGYYSNIDFSEYQDPEKFFPKTKVVEEVFVENWENVLDIEPFPIIFEGNHRRFNSNIRFESAMVKYADGISLNAGSASAYDIYVNDMKIDRILYVEGRPWVDLQTVRFAEPIPVKSVTLNEVNNMYGFAANFNYLSHFELFTDNK